MTLDPMRTPTHHPDGSRLADYAAGSAPEPVAVLMASHLTLCPLCRREVARLERLGGALLEDLPSVPVAGDSLDRLFARIEHGEAEPGPPHRHDTAPASDLPRPLLGYVGASLGRMPWRRVGPIAEARLLTDFRDYTTRLLHVRAGKAIPTHGHMGRELTLVLRGGYSDASGHYRRGDVAEVGPDTDHRPVADPGEDCLCLVVSDAPIKLTGPLGRLLRPFFRR